jgi:hypothetical protein
MKNRGVPHVSKDPGVRNKTRTTMLQRHGGFTFASKELRKRAEGTMRDKYGTKHFSTTDDWYEKCTATSRRKWGCDWSSQDPDIFQRMRSSGYNRKSIVVNGKNHLVQGYEPHALAAIGDKIAKLVTKTNKLPELWYSLEGIAHRYYPDAFIKTLNGKRILLEVKSDFTVRLSYKKNLAKFVAAAKWCQEHDAKFVLALVLANGKKVRTYFQEITSLKSAREVIMKCQEKTL